MKSVFASFALFQRELFLEKLLSVVTISVIHKGSMTAGTARISFQMKPSIPATSRTKHLASDTATEIDSTATSTV
jgi:hypothetical protein